MLKILEPNRSQVQITVVFWSFSAHEVETDEARDNVAGKAYATAPHMVTDAELSGMAPKHAEDWQPMEKKQGRSRASARAFKSAHLNESHRCESASGHALNITKF